MIRGAGRYSTLITPTAGSLFHAEFQRTPLSAIDFSKYIKNEVPFICDLRSSNSELKHKIVAR